MLLAIPLKSCSDVFLGTPLTLQHPTWQAGLQKTERDQALGSASQARWLYFCHFEATQRETRGRRLFPVSVLAAFNILQRKKKKPDDLLMMHLLSLFYAERRCWVSWDKGFPSKAGQILICMCCAGRTGFVCFRPAISKWVMWWQSSEVCTGHFPFSSALPPPPRKKPGL